MRYLYLGVLLCLGGIALAGTISVPAVFSEKMVLQRDVPIPVWGWGRDGDTVTVSMAGHKATTAVKDGAWRVTLPPTPAGGPHTLLIMGKDVTDTLMFTQVLVGEVWLICGQSNAMMPVLDSAEAKDAIAARHQYPNLRVCLGGRRDPHLVTEPQRDVQGFWGPVKWEDSAYTIPRSSRTDIPGGSSAVSYYFGRELYDYFKGAVPVGMLEVTAIMRAESWIGPATVAATPALAPLAGKPYPVATSRCYNANIAPLAPFPIRGVIYYQGEMNAGDGPGYQQALTGIITSWREAWQAPELPFLIVQLPGFLKHLGPQDARLDMDAATLAQFHKENVEHGFVSIREAQLQVWKSVPRTGMAITIDLGDAYDIHPARKLAVGQRLFQQARQLVYGEKNLVASGPVATRCEVAQGRVIVAFDHVGGGLVAKDGVLTGFEVRGEGGFLPAQARIDGHTVIVSHPEVPNPRAVRYAWAGYPQVSLYNREGLPATPFTLLAQGQP